MSESGEGAPINEAPKRPQLPRDASGRFVSAKKSESSPTNPPGGSSFREIPYQKEERKKVDEIVDMAFGIVEDQKKQETEMAEETNNSSEDSEENLGHAELEEKPTGETDATPDTAPKIEEPEEKPTEETAAPPETAEKPREEVIKALNEAVEELKKSIPSGDKPSQEQWTLDAITNALAQSNLEKGIDTHLVEIQNIENGKIIRRLEGIPIDDLIIFLETKAEEAPNEAETARLLKLSDTLIRNSVSMKDSPHSYDGNDYIGEYRERIRHEANLISQDSDYRKKGTPDENWFAAKRALNRRLYLTIPRPDGTKTITPHATLLESSADTNTPLPDTITSSRPSPDIDTVPTTDELPKVEEPKDSEEAPAPEIKPTRPSPDIDTVPSADEVNTTDEEIVVAPAEPDEKTTEPKVEDKDESTPTPTRILADEYNVNIGQAQEGAVKKAQNLTEAELQLADAEGRPNLQRGHLLQRIGRSLKFQFSREGFRHKWLDLTKEARRLEGNERNLNTLQGQNLGTDALNAEVMARVRELRNSNKSVVEQVKLLHESGETQLAGNFLQIEDPKVRKLLLDNVLGPAVYNLRTAVTPEAREAAETQIQKSLAEFVANNQDNAQIKDFFGKNPSRYGEQSKFFASDIAELAQKIIDDDRAEQFANGEIDNLIKINFFNKSQGQASEVDGHITDKIYYWAKRGRLRGKLINTATIGITASAVTFLSKASINSGIKMSNVVATPVAGLATAFLYKNIQERYQTNQELKAVSRDVESGLSAAPDSPRREELEKVLRPMFANASELIYGGGQELLTGRTRRSIGEMIADGNVNEILNRYGEIKARLRMPTDENRGNGVFKNLGMITYDLPAPAEADPADPLAQSVDTRRLDLTIQMLQLKLAAEKLGEDPDQDLGAWSNRLLATREDQRWAYVRMREFRALKHAAGAAAIGGVLGLGIKEGAEFIAGAAGINGESLPRINRSPNEELKGLAQNGGETNIDGYTLSVNPDGAASLSDTSGKEIIADGIKVRENGHVFIPTKSLEDTDALKRFDKAGFKLGAGETTTIPALEATPGTVATDIDDVPVKIPKGTTLVQSDNGWSLVADNDNTKVLAADITFENGKIKFDESESILKMVDVKRVPGAQTEVFGDNGLWEKNSTEITRQWYGNNTRISDYNELRSDNYVFTTSTGEKRVEWDLKRMHGVSFQNENTPQAIEIKKALAEGRVGFAFSTDDDPQNVLWIAADPDGKISLDPTDNEHTINPNSSMTRGEAAKILLNQGALSKMNDGPLGSEIYGHRDVFNLSHAGKPGTIEVGELTSGGPTGTRLNVLASGLGTGGTPTTIDTTTFVFDAPEIQGDQTDMTELIPPEQGTPIFGDKNNDTEIPIIPIPFAPRHPLEPFTSRGAVDRGPDYPYGTGYGYARWEMTSEQMRDYYKGRRSETLNKNPNAKLDFNDETKMYLDKQSPEYKKNLESLISQQGMKEPMDDSCEAIVSIPVYDLGEGQIIQNTLEQYLTQIDKSGNKSAIDPNKFEILLFLNHPFENNAGRKALEEKLGRSYLEGAEERVRNGNPEIYDTEEVIRQFQEAHPELKIRIMKKEFKERPQWGKIIKPLYDAAVMRAMDRKTPLVSDPLIITNDADVVTLSPAYLKNILGESERLRNSGESFDGFGGKVDMPNHGYEKFPGFLAAMRFHQYLDAHNRKKNKYVYTQGRNTVLKGSVYSAIGGVNDSTDAGGDTELGAMVSHARQTDETIRYLNRAWLHTDPRRELGEWEKGVPIVYAWNKWAAMDVYGEDWKAKFGNKPQDPAKLDKDFLETEIQEELKWWRPEREDLVKGLAFIGLRPGDYHIDADGNIKVDSINNLVKNLKDYISEKRWERVDRKIEKEKGNTLPTPTKTEPGLGPRLAAARQKLNGLIPKDNTTPEVKAERERLKLEQEEQRRKEQEKRTLAAQIQRYARQNGITEDEARAKLGL